MYTTNPQSWYDVTIMPPADIRDLVANFRTQGPPVQGVFKHQTAFVPGTIYTNTIAAVDGQVTALSSSDFWTADANQWTATHKMVDSTQPAPVKKVIYMRGGVQWENLLTIALGGTSFSNIQLSFRDNMSTAGDYTSSASTIPVYELSGTFSGNVVFAVTLKQFGRIPVVLRLTDSLGNISFYEMEWVIVN